MCSCRSVFIGDPSAAAGIVHFAGVVPFTAAENSSSTAAEMCSDRKDGGGWRGFDASPGKLVCVFTTKSYLIKSLKTCLRGRAAIWALARLGLVRSRASIQRSAHFCGMPWPQPTHAHEED